MVPLDRSILETPDDDAPRLVWADHEGGDRGEFVVLQCALAKRHADGQYVLSDRAERRRLRARERELFFRHLKTWTQPVREFVSSDVRFERGFLAHARCWLRNVWKPRSVTTLLSRAPLLKSIELWDSSGADETEGASRDELERWVLEALNSFFAQLQAGQPLRSLQVSPSFSVDTFPLPENGLLEQHAYGARVLAMLTAVPMLRSQLEQLTFTADDLEPNALGSFAPLQGLTSLEVTMPVSGTGFVECLRGMPKLRALHAKFDASVLAALEAPEVVERKLTELRLDGFELSDDDLGELAHCKALGSLDALTLRLPSSTGPGFEALVRSPHVSTLRALTLRHASNAVVTQLANASCADRLERLCLRDAQPVTDSAATRLLAGLGALEDLVVSGSALSKAAGSMVRETLPSVLG